MDYLFSSYLFIPHVVAFDFVWLGLVLWTREWAITNRHRFTAGLLKAMACYVVLEIIMHVPAEEAVAVFTGGF